MASNRVVNNAEALCIDICEQHYTGLTAEPAVHKYNLLKEYRNKPIGLLQYKPCLILITPT